jgi:membrane protease YdiL (CAAX protease family)
VSARYLNAVRRGKNAWWRYLLSFVLIIFFWLILGSTPLLIWLAADQLTDDILTVPTGEDQILQYVVLSLSFCFLALGLYLVVTGIHQRQFRSLIRPDARVSLQRIALGGGVWFLLIAVTYLIEVGIAPSHFALTVDWQKWLLFLPLALIFTPIQTTAEELLFRGYMLQSLSLVVRSRWLLIGISSLIFGALHMGNPEVTTTNSPIWLAFTYIAFGVFLAIVTLKDNSLELAIGCHAANNFFLAILVRDQVSALNAPAILTREVSPDAQVEFFLFVIQAAVFYYVFFRKRGPLLGMKKGNGDRPGE